LHAAQNLIYLFGMQRSNPKYQQLFERIEGSIRSGQYLPGQKLPSEAALEADFGASRITVVRALRELQQRGLVHRRAGSGTYVAETGSTSTSLLFGLLIPNLGEAEIFAPICESITEFLQERKHAVLWGNMRPGAQTREKQSLELCDQYIDKRVAGVFFAPLEWTPIDDRINHTVVTALDRAGIPIVLLDRSFMPYRKRSHHDLVSIDHRQAGYMVTNHLLGLGCRRIAFVSLAHSAVTIEARVAGYQEALLRAGLPVEESLVQQINSDNAQRIRELMGTFKPDAIACSNDRTASYVMRDLISLGYRIPDDVRVIGIDDLQYAKLLPVPLTTIHQPCHEIGIAAGAAMLQRLTMPDLPPREILLECSIVVRDSCGAQRQDFEAGS
jgi:GntR family transcriptional regulator of arabinose operon